MKNKLIEIDGEYFEDPYRCLTLKDHKAMMRFKIDQLAVSMNNAFGMDIPSAIVALQRALSVTNTKEL